jgi:hypothetical protein
MTDSILYQDDDELYRVEWKQRLQPADEHRTVLETKSVSFHEAQRMAREMTDNPAYSDIIIVRMK